MAGRAFVAAVSAHPERISEILPALSQHSVDQSFIASAAETLLAKNPEGINEMWRLSDSAVWRSAIAEAMLVHLGRNGPHHAFVWATQLNDVDERSETLRRLFRSAIQRDANAAAVLLSSAWLQEQDRSLLAALAPDVE